jgi:RHS repeat-associated protein
MTDEGRLVPNGSNYDSEYFINDHLGNTRVVVKDSNGKAEVMQESHYYPFGMQMEGMSYSGLLSGVEANKYLYNGKELQDDLGLDWYDYGARFYDAVLGRWHSVDSKAEEAYGWTPYRYALNNPLKFIDPNGMLEDWFVNSENGDVVYEKGKSETSQAGEWENIGEDNMFGDEVLDENGENLLDNESVYMSGEDAEEFMTEQGFEKATVEIVDAVTTTNELPGMGWGRVSQTHQDEKVLDQKISYVKPEKIGERVHVQSYSEKTAEVELGINHSVYKVTSVYDSNRKGLPNKAQTTKTINQVMDWLPQIIKKVVKSIKK